MAIRESAMENVGMMSFWKNKKVFITGHTGFKGGWLSLWLNSLGAEVTGFALAPTTNHNLFTLATIDTHVKSHIKDIRNLPVLKEAVLASEADIIFHLAAQPLVRYSYAHPVETYETNMMGTVNILEAFRASATAKVFVNITTDKCYENNEWCWGYRETDKLGGYDPYSSSKACSELITAAYRSSFFNPSNWHEHGKSIATVRAGNVFGGGDWAEDRLVPDVVMSILNDKEPLIRHPGSKRPWQHVLEPLYGYLLLAEKMWQSAVFAESWNFGPTEESCQSVAYLVQTLCREWGGRMDWLHHKAASPHEATFLKLDISKAQSRLGWRPLLTIDQGLKLTVDWYKAWANGRSALSLTLDQIASYMIHLEKQYA